MKSAYLKFKYTNRLYDIQLAVSLKESDSGEFSQKFD